MNKKRKIFIGSLTMLLIAALYILFHITPNLALRTYVFFSMGHPVSAVITGIRDTDYYTDHVIYKDMKEMMVKEHAKAYTLTKPPKEENVELSNYVVKKAGFLYFADYIGYD
ncbi:hypothetical protein [Neobacillus fumarioli]|uniref:hypothetical protein n=1 Tax=Neobacillus fumarioli TaxID=105229 RepID=UPI00082C809D|nr:hypothetical protein [Neobacillus fumarioli]